MNKKLENEYGNGDILFTERFYGNQVHLSEDRCFQVFKKYWCW